MSLIWQDIQFMLKNSRLPAEANMLRLILAYMSIILGCVSLTCSVVAKDVELENFKGTFGNKGITFRGGEHGYLGYLECGADDFTTNFISKSKNSGTIQILGQDYKKIIKSIRVTRSVSKWKGINVEILNAKNVNLDGRTADLNLMRSVDERYRTWTGIDASCLNFAWEPNTIVAVTELGSNSKIKEWARAHDVQFEPSKGNAYTFSAPTGLEEQCLASLKKQPWIIDARRYGEGAGPDFAWVQFKLGAIYKPGDSQDAVRLKLFEVVQKTFPLANLNDDSLTAKRGFSYDLDLFEPVGKLGFNNAEFRGYWLKAKVNILVNRQLADNGVAMDLMEISIPDGWLPRWPEDSTVRPPLQHVKQYHLAPDGSDHLKNFFILSKVQEKITKALSKKWDGEAEIPTDE